MQFQGQTLSRNMTNFLIIYAEKVSFSNINCYPNFDFLNRFSSFRPKLKNPTNIFANHKLFSRVNFMIFTKLEKLFQLFMKFEIVFLQNTPEILSSLLRQCTFLHLFSLLLYYNIFLCCTKKWNINFRRYFML